MKKKYIILIVSLIVVAIIIFFLIKTKSKEEKITDVMEGINDKDKEIINKYGIKNLKICSFPLKIGSSGWQVELVQIFLNKTYNSALGVDGIWGAKTQIEVSKNLKVVSISNYEFETYKRFFA